MSFWDSKNLPVYNLKGGFMLHNHAFTSDFTPGGVHLGLPQPATSTSAPNLNNSDNKNAVSKLLSRIRDAEEEDEEGFLSNLWSRITGDSTTESEDERSVSIKNVSKIMEKYDEKELKEKYLKYKKKYFKAKYNIDL